MLTPLFNSGFRNWKPEKLPDLSGKTYVITGGNSGIGLEAAKMLAAKGGEIIIACRNAEKARLAEEVIENQGSGCCRSVILDLASLASVRKAANELKTMAPKIDGLINNAGIMQTPKLATQDGFEMQLGTNHLGHFLWTGLLYEQVKKTEGRIVVVSSIAHKMGRIHFKDIMLEKGYSPTKAYTQSKLANLLFALELNRKLEAAGSPVSVMACHPGYSNTALQSTGPTGLLLPFYKVANTVVSQPAEKGAIPTVLCAAGLEARAGGYYGPKGFAETRGRVSDAIVMPRARSKRTAAKLWNVSEELVGFEWDQISAA